MILLEESAVDNVVDHRPSTGVGMIDSGAEAELRRTACSAAATNVSCHNPPNGIGFLGHIELDNASLGCYD